MIRAIAWFIDRTIIVFLAFMLMHTIKADASEKWVMVIEHSHGTEFREFTSRRECSLSIEKAALYVNKTQPWATVHQIYCVRKEL